eukprot:127581_1
MTSFSILILFMLLLSIERINCTREEYEGTIRLVNGPSGNNQLGNDPYKGRVEIFKNGEWGTICDDFHVNAIQKSFKVICRQLGYTTVDRYYTGDAVRPYGVGSSPQKIHLDDINCAGSELYLLECPRLFPKTSDTIYCGHSEDINVECSGYIGSSDILELHEVEQRQRRFRLVGGNEYGNDPHFGAVEFLYGNIWGSVCDDLIIGANGGNVVESICWTLGYGTYEQYWGNEVTKPYSSPAAQINLDNIVCPHEVMNILQFCTYKIGWEAHNCKHNEDLVVSCKDFFGPVAAYHMNRGKSPIVNVPNVEKYKFGWNVEKYKFELLTMVLLIVNILFICVALYCYHLCLHSDKNNGYSKVDIESESDI